MQTRSTDALPLAPRPSLEHYRKCAKDLHEASRAGPAEVRAWAEAWLARLARRIEEQPDAPAVAPATAPDAVPAVRERARAARIRQEAESILQEVAQSRLLDSAAGAAAPGLSEAQLVIARLHGFESWPKFVRHIEARRNAASPVARFEAAADAIVTGASAALAQLLRQDPGLVRARSSRDHRATLLHYVAANGHEGFRQQTPRNAVEIARLLLEAGAAADALAHMYGRPSTTLEMLVSSVHPHAAGVQSALAELLLDFGAAVDGVDGDGSPLMTAFRFHFPRTAETLARRGARVDNVISAAALGRADLIEQFVDEHGRLRPGVPLARVPWPNLPPDPAVHLAYALTWACAFGRDAVAELLLRKGVPAASGDSDATALHFAAAYGRMELVRLLLRHGASLESRNSYGGTVLGGTVWYALNSPIEGVDHASVVRELLAAGARTDVYPEMRRFVERVLAGQRGGGDSEHAP